MCVRIDTGFPGVAGKYIYCPSKVYSLYQEKGMAKEMKWNEFQKSPYYEAEMGGRKEEIIYMCICNRLHSSIVLHVCTWL